MTGRERIRAFLNGGKIDRIPNGLGVQPMLRSPMRLFPGPCRGPHQWSLDKYASALSQCEIV